LLQMWTWNTAWSFFIHSNRIVAHLAHSSSIPRQKTAWVFFDGPLFSPFSGRLRLWLAHITAVVKMYLKSALHI